MSGRERPSAFACSHGIGRPLTKRGAAELPPQISLPRVIPTEVELARPVTAEDSLLHPARFLNTRARILYYTKDSRQGDIERTHFRLLHAVERIEIRASERPARPEPDTMHQEYDFGFTFSDFFKNGGLMYAIPPAVLKELPAPRPGFDLGSLTERPAQYISFGRQDHLEYRPGHFIDGAYVAVEGENVRFFFSTIAPAFVYSANLNIAAYPDPMLSCHLDNRTRVTFSKAMDTMLSLCKKEHQNGTGGPVLRLGMRPSFLSLLFVILTTGSLFASDITPEEAAKHVGEKVTVRGTVFQVFVSKSKNVYLNFGATFPNQTFAAAVLIQKTPALLADGSDWLTAREGKEVSVTGTVELYKDKPEIVLTPREDLNTSPGK